MRARCASLLIFLSLARAAAGGVQSAQDRAWYERFVDGIASAVYGFAWPTATYQRVELERISPVAGGADVTFRLHGASAWASGDLWLQVVMQIRDGQVKDFKWGENNGFWPPGATSGAILDALNSAMQETKTGRATPAASSAVAVVCFNNTSKGELNYHVTVGKGSKQPFSLAAGRASMMTVPAPAETFVVSFDDSFAPGITEKTMAFNAPRLAQTPSTCSDELFLDFL